MNTNNVIIAHIPVIHKGYMKLFEEYRGYHFYLINLDVLGFLDEFPYLERDMRALDVDVAFRIINDLYFINSTSKLSPRHIEDIRNSENVVMPDEDVTRWFAEEYLDGMEVQFVESFLRWDWKNAPVKEVVVPDVIISKLEFDRNIICLAEGYAEKSSDWWRHIGAVIVKDGEMLYWGYNKHIPSPYTPYINGDIRTPFLPGECIYLSSAEHGEAGVIARAAATSGNLAGSDIYVTTFPCPGCARMIISAGIKRVFYKEGYSLAHASEDLKSSRIEIIKVE